MLTPKDVSSKTFPKAVMGGYAMTSVDDFLDKLTDDYTTLYKDNAALKAKIKLLAEKMEESRKSEDAFRSLIVSAQKVADDIVAKAEAERDRILAEAENKRSAIMGDAEEAARQRIGELRAEVQTEEQRLTEKKQEVADAIAAEEYRLERTRSAVSSFMELSRSSCKQQLEILQRLEDAMPPAPERPAAAAVAVAADAADDFDPAAVFAPEEEADDYLPGDEEDLRPDEVDEEEDKSFFTQAIPSLSGLKDMLLHHHAGSERAEVSEEEPEMDEYEDAPDDEEAGEDLDSVQDDVASLMAQFAQEDDDQHSLFTTSPEEATRVINLDDLQFGRNYNGGE